MAWFFSKNNQQAIKEVIDFTNYSTSELIGYFTTYTGGGTCGRIKSSQLGTYTITVNPRVLQ